MRRRGVAMLLVLGATLLVVSSLATTVLTVSSRQRSVLVTEHERRAEDLLLAAEPIVVSWLTRASPRAVVDPRLPSPRTDIANIDLGPTARIQMTAYDLLGMMPSTAKPTHPLWRAVPAEFRVDEDDASAGSLSLLADPLTPAHPDPESGSSRLGDRVAFRSSAERRRPVSGPVILNINTAPRPLLEAALRLGQRGDSASIFSSRLEGRSAPAPVSNGRAGADSDATGLVRLVGRSTLWAVRVDASSGPVDRSWWTVYQSRGRGWQIVERHEIAD